MMHTNTRVLVISVLCACCAACRSDAGATVASVTRQAALRLEPGHPHLQYVKLEKVAASPLQSAISLTGKVAFDEDHTQRVASPVDGRVTGVLARLGEKVRTGQPLVMLSSPQVGQIQADALKAQSDLALSQKAMARAHRLRGDGAISEKEVAQIEADNRKARADVARTTAQLGAIGISPTDPNPKVSLRGRVGGVIAERNVLLGQEVRADQVNALLTISDLDNVWVLADVYEQDLGLVGAGGRVKVQVAAYPGQIFDGYVGHVGDVVDPSTRTVKLRCIVPNPEHRLKPEMFARVEVAARPGQLAMTVPSSAVLNQGDHTQVIVASTDHLFRPRQVEVGPEQYGRVRVLSGLRTGETIVAEGALFLQQEIETQ
jgi:membrane fusion protein, heavy metal efflux system